VKRSPAAERAAPQALDLDRLLVAAHMTGWPRALTWDDFPVAKRVPRALPRDAVAWIKPAFRYSFIAVRTELGRFVTANVRVEVFVVREHTGVLRRRRGRYVLKHEQGHFDIAGLCGRELCAALLQLEAQSPQELTARAEELLRHTAGRVNGLNRLYDSLLGGTCRGLNPLGQWRWNRRLDEAIARWKPLPPVKPYWPPAARPSP